MAFDSELFRKFCDKYGIEKRPLTQRRHNKNVIVSKHRIIRDVYIRLKDAAEQSKDDKETKEILIKQAISITNDLYGSDIASSHEIAKGYARPVDNGSYPKETPKEIIEAHENLKAKRKLTLILRSKSTTDEEFLPGSQVQIFIKKGHEKRGKWSGDKTVLAFDPESRMVTVPGSNGKQIRAAVEDVRLSLPTNCFSRTVQESIDILDQCVEDELQNVRVDEYQDEEHEMSLGDEDEVDDGPDDEIPKLPKVGDSIEVYWKGDNKFYPGTVGSFNPKTGDIHVDYDDGDKEDLKIQNETWRFGGEENVVANGIELTPGMNLSSIEKEVVDEYYRVFGNKEFLRHQAEGLPQFATQNAYVKEEESFTKTVRKVHVRNIPNGSNVISNHVLYKVKVLDDGSKKIKARIAPHGNKDKDRENLKTDSAMCSPLGMRIILSIASINRWNLAKIDFTAAFLQSGNAVRDVYVMPQRECKTRFVYWLLLTASYGLVNASAKWQEEIDGSLSNLGFVQLAYVPQLFYRKDSAKRLEIVAVKVVDDVLFAADPKVLRKVVVQVARKYDVGTIVYSPGKFLFNGLQIQQDEDYVITVDADGNLDNLSPMQVERTRRKQVEEDANAVEISAYRSLTGSLGWIGVAASPFCAYASSILQQNLPKLEVKNIVEQVNHVKLLKTLGTATKYRRPKKKGGYGLKIVMFSDANRKNSSGQIGFIAGLVIGEFAKDSPFHVLSWKSQKSKRPVRSIGSAETIAAVVAIDEGKLLAASFRKLINVEITLQVCVDSKDLWDSLTTCHEPTDKSVKADVNVIRYEFETKNVSSMTWIPGKTNPADSLTKKDSPMNKPLQLMLFEGIIPLNFTAAKTRKSEVSTG